MNCLHCGTELDRKALWRDSHEYCSEACKKTYEEESDQLAMRSLMRPRTVRRGAVAAGQVRTVESGAGKLTVVTHRPGASVPVVTEPPEAEYLQEMGPSVVELTLRTQPFVASEGGRPVVPDAGVAMADALTALGAILEGMRPERRPARALRREKRSAVAWPAAKVAEAVLPGVEPVWIRSLGVEFGVVGLEGGGEVRVLTQADEEPVWADGAAGLAEEEELEELPRARYVAIPSRRGRRPVEWEQPVELGEEWTVSAPVVTPPRLRIHLPKPVTAPFRPRYAFAPKPAVEGAAAERVEAAEAVVAERAAEPLETAGAKDAGKDAGTSGEAAPMTYRAPSFGGLAEQPDDGWLRRLVGWRKAGTGMLLVASLAGWGAGEVRAATEPAGVYSESEMGMERRSSPERFRTAETE